VIPGGDHPQEPGFLLRLLHFCVMPVVPDDVHDLILKPVSM
jgi:hypothetical protein